MPYAVQVWVEDCDDGQFNVYVDDGLIQEKGARALQAILNSVQDGWRRLDESTVRRALHAVTG
ncbi:hypothetical protein OOK06_36910 [Streptomyces sp. NBC_00340]|jgi:hypothetical protein|uniref:hypothetical protein n=1 Tax=unclassified Streptomyces TaxID=2593676 RepID=UPI00225A6CE8|nr:hypothetical protein [Streptomyces sp. NBC_00340]MCX5137653.1 hypothetical protein [Streptomyces sp. NBC_00340]